jgi:hypothetical protein
MIDISDIVIVLFQRVIGWVISFFKRMRGESVLQKRAVTETDIKIINNITVINPIIINHAKSQILEGQSRGARK